LIGFKLSFNVSISDKFFIFLLDKSCESLVILDEEVDLVLELNSNRFNISQGSNSGLEGKILFRELSDMLI